MPSPLVPVQYRSPAHSTSYERPLVAYDAPCVCGLVVPWTATASGAQPHCPTCEAEDVA